MTPTLALLVWFVCLVALLRFDPAKQPSVSWAMYLPLTWMLIMGSRLPSQWMNLGATVSPDAYLEGSPLDRVVFLALLFGAFVVLRARSITIGQIVSKNVALSIFLLFGLISLIWSDYPYVGLKRWVRDLSLYLVILVTLTETDPNAAFQWLIRRFSYLLIPLSIVFMKYFPEISRSYDAYSGEPFFRGATTQKNMLGVVCLVVALFYIWDILRRWSARRDPVERRILLLDAAFLAMTIWLLMVADSATSVACLLLGAALVVYMRRRSIRHSPGKLRYIVPITVCIVLLGEAVFDLSGMAFQALGRDATFTGRTDLWADVLRVASRHAVLGAGYETFWLGERLAEIHAIHTFRPNQAHDGYIEVYANLGFVGLALLICFLIATFLGITRRMGNRFDYRVYGFAMWCIVLIYNVTEAAFKSHLMWFAFLVGAINPPEKKPSEDSLPADNAQRLPNDKEPATPHGRDFPVYGRKRPSENARVEHKHYRVSPPRYSSRSRP